MITNTTYYKGDIYIPEAKPSITEELLETTNNFSEIISGYEEECFIDIFGFIFYNEFASQLNLDRPTLLKDEAHEKWGWLLNGHSYLDARTNKLKAWRGIRFKTPITAEKYNRSFLAYYAYCRHERRQHVTNTTVGQIKEKVKNAQVVAPTLKVVDAWNKYVDIVQGKCKSEKVIYKHELLGLDYYKGNKEVSLYDFIKDMNKAYTDFYKNVHFKDIRHINRFGF